MRDVGRGEQEVRAERDRLAADGVQEMSFSLRKGEILGITGLADSGRNELAMALTGVAPASGGTLTLESAPGTRVEAVLPIQEEEP